MTVTQTGQTEENSSIFVTVRRAADPCPATYGYSTPGRRTEVAAGSFSASAQAFEDQGNLGDGQKRVCGYLFYASDPLGTGTDQTPRAAASAVTPEQQLAVRALGVNTLRVYGARVSRLSPFCVFAGKNTGPSGCEVEARASIKVSAATRRKLGLRSTTIATGDEVAPCGESRCLNLTASRAVRNRLKKVKRVPVVYTLKVSAPIKETITKRVTLIVQRTTKLAEGAERLAFRSADDTFAVSGRG
jgi:hypothetical protein